MEKISLLLYHSLYYNKLLLVYRIDIITHSHKNEQKHELIRRALGLDPGHRLRVPRPGLAAAVVGLQVFHHEVMMAPRF